MLVLGEFNDKVALAEGVSMYSVICHSFILLMANGSIGAFSHKRVFKQKKKSVISDDAKYSIISLFRTLSRSKEMCFGQPHSTKTRHSS